jgi:hypothetical protein
MPDPTPTPAPEGSGTQPDDKKTPEGQPTPEPAPTPEPKPDDKPKTFTQEEVNRLLAKEKRDAEKRAKDAEDKAKLSEDERTKAELADAKAQLAERDRRDTVKEAAEKAGIKNGKLFYNAYKDELETDDKGKITNLTEVLEAAKAEAPELFGTPQKPSPGSADAGAGNDGKTGLTKEQVEKMTPAEINANWEEVSKFLTSQK